MFTRYIKKQMQKIPIIKTFSELEAIFFSDLRKINRDKVRHLSMEGEALRSSEIWPCPH